jgi:hypothetical protein
MACALQCHCVEAITSFPASTETHTMSAPFRIFDSAVGRGWLTIELGQTTFSLSLKLDQGGVYFAKDLTVNWSPEVLVQFGKDVADFKNWSGLIAIPPKFDDAPVAVTRVSGTRLQIRVGYNRTPSSLIFNGIITLDTGGVPTTNPSHPRSTLPLLEVGSRITLVSSNSPNMRVGHHLQSHAQLQSAPRPARALG